MILNAKASSSGDASYVLLNHGVEVGWLRDGRVSFIGFRDADSARRGAHIAAGALLDWYRGRWRTPAPLAPDGAVPAECRIDVGGVTIGCLDAADDATGFTLRVPDELWVATAVELGQRMWTRLRDAGATPSNATAVTPAG